MTNEARIWLWLWERIGNAYGVAGLMGNLLAESALNPRNLQNSYEKKLGYSDDEYVWAVDSGAYPREMFITDRAGFGLAQWTHPDRKRALMEYAEKAERSIGSLEMQLGFLMKEMAGQYKSALNTLYNAGSVKEASDAVMLKYEAPADTSEENRERRAELGRKIYGKYAGTSSGADAPPSPEGDTSSAPVGAPSPEGKAISAGAGGAETGAEEAGGGADGETDGEEKKGSEEQKNGIMTSSAPVGAPSPGGKALTVVLNERAKEIIEEAERLIGCEYVFGARGEYRNGRQIFDCRGYTWWLLKKVGISISPVGATSQWNAAGDWLERGEIRDIPNAVCCVFKRDAQGNKMSHTGMHIGGGVILHCTSNGGVKYGKITDSGWSHYAVPKGLYTAEEIEEARGRNVRTLRNGSSGEDVKELQETLIRMGYEAVGTADGIFGKKTEEGVKQFQKDNGLTADGIVGEKTRAKMTGTSSGASAPTSQEGTTGTSSAPVGTSSTEEDERTADGEAPALRSWVKYPLDMAMAQFMMLAELLGYTVDTRSGNVSQIDYQ